jgi:hypothetical protein
MLEDERIKIINFLQDFGCATLKQLQILYNKPNDNFKGILTGNFVSKKGDIFIHNNEELNMKTIYALNVLCKYKGRFKQFHKGYDPVYLTFLTKDNILYNVIVTDKNNEQGVLKLLRVNSPYIPEADKFILLFEDDTCYDKIECSTPYAYCVYPELKIINRKNA